MLISSSFCHPFYPVNENTLYVKPQFHHRNEFTWIFLVVFFVFLVCFFPLTISGVEQFQSLNPELQTGQYWEHGIACSFAEVVWVDCFVQ